MALPALAPSRPAASPSLDADARLIDRLGAEACLQHRVVPLRRAGAVCLVGASGVVPEGVYACLGPVRTVAMAEDAVASAVTSRRRQAMIRRAETLVPLAQSCRRMAPRGRRLTFAAVLATLSVTLAVAPQASLTALTAAAVLVLLANTALTARVMLAGLDRRHPPHVAVVHPPVVSLLVPLLRESEVAETLLARLARLDYPRNRLDLCLVVEEDDLLTQATVARAGLPHWARLIRVPRGTVRTKPRALNYALPFCRGSVIGIYDAEDAPEPDQIWKVVRHFHARGPDVACLQAALDTYNPRQSWLTRGFTLDYAIWFRVILPGLAAAGLVLPLGGTSVFFRRTALERVGAWDAHNVTEDADLGLRLARHGFRTELVDSTTREEAGARPWVWVRQRSRWIKGYAMTYVVHMRDPLRLWRDLGGRRFVGVQILFLGAVLGFLLMPTLWVAALYCLGAPVPWASALPGLDPWLLPTLGGCALVRLAAGICAIGLRGPPVRTTWLPLLPFYFALGFAAAVKAMHETLAAPFFWDKTAHGTLSRRRKR